MGFVIGGFLGLALIVGTIWLAVFLWAQRGERRRRAEEARVAERERLLQTPGARLRCESCEREFAGPLPGDGCPGCHCAAFVTAQPPLAAPTPAASATPPLTAEVPSSALAAPEAETGERVSVGTGGAA